MAEEGEKPEEGGEEPEQMQSTVPRGWVLMTPSVASTYSNRSCDTKSYSL